MPSGVLMGQLQKDMVRRHILASSGAVLFTLLFIASSLLAPDKAPPAAVVLSALCYWSGQALLLYWVASGRSRHYPDPGMTPVFMGWAVAFISLTFYFCHEYRTLVLLGYLMVMPYGVFRLTWRGFLGVALLAIASYTGVLLLLRHEGKLVWNLTYELLAGGAFFASMLAYSILGREVSLLRAAYRNKNHELRRALTRIEDLAATDELTGLYNRRHLLSHIDQQRALANREGMPFVLAFVDIDHFKQINDHHGHRVGDQVLAELAAVLRLSIREVDLAARYGGEEFVLLFSGLTLGTAGKVLDRIRMDVMEQRFSRSALPLTVSVGVAQYFPGEAADDLLNRADRLLYEAKRLGRNRVMLDSQETGVLQSVT